MEVSLSSASIGATAPFRGVGIGLAELPEDWGVESLIVYNYSIDGIILAITKFHCAFFFLCILFYFYWIYKAEMQSAQLFGKTIDTTSVSVFVPRTALLRWNIFMAFAHTTMVGITLYIGKLDLRVPVYATRITVEVGHGNSTDGWRHVPLAPERVGWLYLTVATAAFFAASAIAHIGAATCWREVYYKCLANAYAPFRWIEYSASASIMIVIISYLSSIIDAHLLSLICGLTVVTMIHGYIHEVICRPQSPVKWTIDNQWSRLQGHFAGYVPYAVAWALIIYRFMQAASRETVDADGQTRSMPDFVYAIVFGEIIVFSCFAIVQFVTTLRPPSEYANGEIAYMWLSLIAKGMLGGILLTNVLTLQQFDDIYETGY